MNIFKEKMLKLSVAVTMLSMVGTSSSVLAASGSNGTAVSQNVVTSISTIPQIINAFSYIAGLALGVLGILKIKDHVENPSNASLKDGAIRLLAGGALLSLPMLFEVVINSFGTSANAVAQGSLGNIAYTP